MIRQIIQARNLLDEIMLLAARLRDRRSSSIYLSVILDLTISYGYAYRSSKHSILGFLRPLTNKENTKR